jgi:very-short-patch-repair endonuclease
MEYFCQLPLSKRHAINVARLRKAATPAELQMKDFLASLGAPYRFQQGFYTPYYRIVDFYLPTMNLVIEIDGPCHDAAKDRRRDDWFTRVRGIRIVRLTNEQVLRGDSPRFLNQFLNGPERTGRRAWKDCPSRGRCNFT